VRDPETIRASVRNKVEWKNDKERTEKLLKMQSDVNDRDLSKRFDDEIKDIISNFKLIDRNGLDRQSDLIYRNLEMAIQSGNIDVIKRLWKEISDKG
jgi:short-subunit dehydrogenase involved in D-alanine esterification of teichoic acids